MKKLMAGMMALMLAVALAAPALAENEDGVKKVLSAAALTYLGALIMAIANLLRILAIAGMSRRN